MIYMEIKCLASLNSNNNNIYNWTNSHLCCALLLVLCPSDGLRIISSLLFASGKVDLLNIIGYIDIPWNEVSWHFTILSNYEIIEKNGKEVSYEKLDTLW